MFAQALCQDISAKFLVQISATPRIEGGMNDAWESSLQKLLLCGSQYVVHVTLVCRTQSASRLSRPGAGYP